MAIYPFTKACVDYAPAEHGIYVLYDDSEMIYIGAASGYGVTIRSRLQRHLAGSEGYCTKAATGYEWIISSNPLALEERMLRNYKAKFGQLPRCNERIG